MLNTGQLYAYPRTLWHEQTCTFAVSRAVVHLIFSICFAQKMHIRHLNMCSAFTAELRDNKMPIHDNQPPIFDGIFKHPSKPYWILHLNLYGSKSAGQKYYHGVTEHLLKHNTIQSKVDPCFYTINMEEGNIVISVAKEDFLRAFPNHEGIKHVTYIRSRKYSVKDLGPSSTFRGRDFIYFKPGKI